MKSAGAYRPAEASCNMASDVSDFLDASFMQIPSHQQLFPAVQGLSGGELPFIEEFVPFNQVTFFGNSERQLTLRQAPIYARVAVGKEKDRRPIDPPPVVQLIDKRYHGRTGLYDSPYLFMISSLVPENYDEEAQGPLLPSDYLTGSLASSVYRLRDTGNVEGGFFVFGDLSVKQEGRFRLRFTLYERDDNHSAPSFSFVGGLITSVFTVFPVKFYPGVADSTPLTRTFSDQGVKVRLRKDLSTISTRKRNRQESVSTSSSSVRDRQPERASYDQEMPSLCNSTFSSEFSPIDPMAGSMAMVTTIPLDPNLYATTEPVSSPTSDGLDLHNPTGNYYFGGPHYY